MKHKIELLMIGRTVWVQLHEVKQYVERCKRAGMRVAFGERNLNEVELLAY